ncbi:heavy metal translocating P-type ATPase [Methermicoccus shengliensis]|uniref:Cadmium-translocating P-type ATPase n=1 Tax=Methermicoccus shengliensis TaxID=660064 RepID=A0A832RT59_9EURY|nr:cation-translocating P-type ATPase [Methermicoccus shengliensis]KUK04015.1 MAG: Heavy metal translocating P-type ATPase [Euryarchaeota archaeon 55_53]KUK29752.1 MAG: Heavy metal translocating P-type ATPase [Methanosarcinales archeaon 56_1174]MDI3488548.1 Zn2+/Cd2+-exporting ATPase [Methanosarcinales archaeon]MDN5295869.1 Zn2+/Cd2+-exporting ATPase [Methanosarcinales archaeon]HIH69943.1 cadmium-translocating P-type ATPase [Methermicoccus shengliensis]
MSEACASCDVGSGHGGRMDRGAIVRIVLGAFLLGLGIALHHILGIGFYPTLLYATSAIIAGYEIVIGGMRALVHKRRFTVDLLVAVAAAGAFAIGHGEEGAAVMVLFSVAEWLERLAEHRARSSIDALLSLAPKTARVLKDGKELEVPVHDVERGDVVVVRPGDSIPLDGVVVRGKSLVNQASITGEPLPVYKEVGDEVFASTLSEDGYLEVRVSKKSTETLLSRIVDLVQEAQRTKSPTERFIDGFSRYYTPSVIVLALMVAIVPSLLFGSYEEWVYRALVLLVISCPCALAISTPVSMVSAITSAARNGVLIKGGAHVEEVGKTKVVAFDKTGTLTRAQPALTEIIPLNGASREEVLAIAGALEAHSNHPLARPIVDASAEVPKPEVREFSSLTGLGVRGLIDGGEYYAGSLRLFQMMGVPTEHIDGIEGLDIGAKSLVLVGTRERLLGVLTFEDTLRDGAVNTVEELKRRGIRTVMVTGDTGKSAMEVARELGVDECLAELSPEDKVKVVRRLRREYGHVLMVGDGVNDAPALAAASVGVAMGAAGSDVALESAHVALMLEDLTKLIYLLDLSAHTNGVVRQNVFSSILVKGGFAILALLGMITLWMAVGFGDVGLSLLVILNAMRLSLLKG